MISCELSDGRVVQFKERTRLFTARYTGYKLRWNAAREEAGGITAGDWIGLENEIVKVLRVTETKN